MSVRRPIAALIAIVAALAVASCTSSFSAETNRAYDAAKGPNSRDTPVQIHNALLVDNAVFDSEGQLAGDDPRTATLSASFINTTDQPVRITGFSASTIEGSPLNTQLDRAFDVPTRTLTGQGETALPAVTVAGRNSAEFIVQLGTDAQAGQNLILTFEFDNIDNIEMIVPVVSRLGAPIYGPDPDHTDDAHEAARIVLLGYDESMFANVARPQAAQSSGSAAEQAAEEEAAALDEEGAE